MSGKLAASRINRCVMFTVLVVGICVSMERRIAAAADTSVTRQVGVYSDEGKVSGLRVAIMIAMATPTSLS